MGLGGLDRSYIKSSCFCLSSIAVQKQTHGAPWQRSPYCHVPEKSVGACGFVSPAKRTSQCPTQDSGQLPGPGISTGECPWVSPQKQAPDVSTGVARCTRPARGRSQRAEGGPAHHLPQSHREGHLASSREKVMGRERPESEQPGFSTQCTLQPLRPDPTLRCWPGLGGSRRW